ncbi:tetratricopeptide repeat protein [Spirochaetota bacterium]
MNIRRYVNLTLFIVLLLSSCSALTIKKSSKERALYLKGLQYFNNAMIIKNSMAFNPAQNPVKEIDRYLDNLKKAENIFKRLVRTTDNDYYKFNLFKVYYHIGTDRLEKKDARRIADVLKATDNLEIKVEFYELLGKIYKYYKKDLDTALFNLKKAEEYSDITNCNVLYEIGEIYFFQKKYKLAKNYFQTVYENRNTEVNPAYIDRSLYYLGDIEFNLMNDDEAIMYYDKIAESYYLGYNEKIKVNSILANNAAWKGEFEDTYKRKYYLYKITDSINFLYETVEYAYCAGTDISVYLNNIAEISTDSEDELSTVDEYKIKIMQAIRHEHAGEYLKAHRVFRELEKENSDHFPVLFGLFFIAKKLSSKRDIIHYYQKIAILYFLRQNNKKSLAYLEELEKNYPNSDIDLINIGMIYIKNGEEKKGEDYFSKYLLKKEYDENSLLKIAYYYDTNKKFKESIDTFKLLIKHYPKKSEYYYYLGIEYNNIRQYNNSLGILQKAEKLSPENSDILFQLGTVHERLGNFSKAENYFLKTIKEDPTHGLAYNYIGYLYADRNINLRKAEDYLLKALELDPDNSAFLDSFAWLYYRKEDYKNAKTFIDKALAIHEKEKQQDYILYDHAGDIYYRLQDHPRAKLYWQKAIDINIDTSDNIQDKLNIIDSEKSK